jgi:hypothetical protein
VFEHFKDMKDAKTKKKLLGQLGDQMKTTLRKARLGLYSDVPDCNLYTITGHDAAGLALYRCDRGTNKVESYHQRLMISWPRYCRGPQMAGLYISMVRTRHNIDTAVRLGLMPNFGHYNLKLIDNIQIWSALVGMPVYSHWIGLNRFDFSKLKVRSSTVIHNTSDLFPIVLGAEVDVEAKLPSQLQYLKECSGYIIPPLPFANSDEYQKYGRWISQFESSKQLKDEQLAKEWNLKVVDVSESLFPKQPWHFRQYKERIKKNQNCRTTYRFNNSTVSGVHAVKSTPSRYGDV